MPRHFAPNLYQPGKASILGRPTCYRCFRPEAHCVCSLISPFYAHVNTLILQHPNERKKYYSTAKLLVSAIENSRVLRGVEFCSTQLEELLAGQECYLLYPSATASDCSEVSLSTKNTVIVIDGTWREAGKIIFRNSFLKELPQLSFKRQLQSQYHIRKQPKAGCLSTIESVAHLLVNNAAVSGEQKRLDDYQRLFSGFNQMISQQLSYWPSREMRGNAADLP